MKSMPERSRPSRAEPDTTQKSDAADALPLKGLTIYTDGASRGNPGEAGAGVIIYDRQGTIVKKIKASLGTTTNNVAEYMALIIALKEAVRLKADALQLFSDSELMVRQLKGIYKVKDRKMQALAAEARKLLSNFIRYDIVSVPRAQNREADKLANLAIDEKEQQ
jgi:ribonuclease HI